MTSDLPAGEPAMPDRPSAPDGRPLPDSVAGAAPLQGPAGPGPLWGAPQPTAPLSPATTERPYWAPPREDSRRSRLPAVGKAIGAILVVVLVFSAGLGVGRLDSSATSDQAVAPAVPASLPPEFATYTEAWKILHDNYVDPSALDPRTLTYGSVDGLVKAVRDTDHTRFLTPDEVKEEHTSLSGSIVGIGALMSTQSGAAIIQSVIPGGPADRAGLRSGDHVLAVDGTPTDNQDLNTVVKRIRGDAGTTVKLLILHEGDADPAEVSIVREKVTVPAVSWALVPGTTIADLRLEEFSTGSADQVRDAIAAAKKAGATALVLDLRADPGGYVNEAVDIASEFIKDGLVYQQRDKTGKTETIPVKSGGTATSIPMAVLVDNGSASSAEILAGALQDAKRGQLIGKTTFGTGTVLNEFPLKDGSAILVGTIEWLTRDGRQIWKHGIDPDMKVESNPPGKIIPPTEFAKLGADGVAKSGDGPLLKAVEILKGSGTVVPALDRAA